MAKKLKVSSRKNKRNKKTTDLIKGIDLFLNSPNKLGRHNTSSFSSVTSSKTDYNRKEGKKIIRNYTKDYE